MNHPGCNPMQGHPPSGDRLRFGVFEVDLRSGELWKSGTRLAIQEQPFRILVKLLWRPGEPVTREELRQELWPADTFVDFEHGLNAAIKRLRDALGDTAESPRYIETLPRRGYRFIAPAAPRETAIPAVHASPPNAGEIPDRRERARKTRRWLAILAIAMASTSLAGLWFAFLRQQPDEARAAFQSRPLTTYRGLELRPAVSPDGNFVAFRWNGPSGGEQFDLFVKQIDGGEPIPLAGCPNPHRCQALSWSPNGRFIAFSRAQASIAAQVHDVMIVPALGGAEQFVATLRMDEPFLSWAPDGQAVVCATDEGRHGSGSRIVRISIDDKTITPLTTPPHEWSDTAPEISPDGSTLAFLRSRTDNWSTDVMVQPVGKPSLAERLVADVVRSFGGTEVHWTPDGKSLVFIRDGSLVRLDLEARKSTPLPVAGPARHFSIGGNRLVFSKFEREGDIWRVSGPAADVPVQPAPIISSTAADFWAEYSPDGRQIVFHSNRSGRSSLWLSDDAGRNVTSLVDAEEMKGEVHQTRWSPNGRRVAVSVLLTVPAPQNDLHVVDVNPSRRVVRRLLDWSSGELNPVWSQDGKYLYFSSDRSDAPGIWRITVDGPPDPVRIAAGRDILAFAEEGGFLYQFTLENARATDLHGTISRLNLSTKRSEDLISGAWASNYCVWKGTILHIQYQSLFGSEAVVVQFDPTTKTTRTVSAIGRNVFNLNVSPDGRWMLFTRRNIHSDLVLVENSAWTLQKGPSASR